MVKFPLSRAQATGPGRVAVPGTLLSEGITAVITHCIIIAADVSGVVYAHEAFETMVAIGPTVRFSLIAPEKHILVSTGKGCFNSLCGGHQHPLTGL